MKRKRKLLEGLFVLTCGVMLCACSASSGETKPTSAPTATVTPEPTATVIPESTATATPEPTATATPEPTKAPEPEIGYTKGVSTETGWESEWMNLRFTAPEGIIMATEEELDELLALGAEVVYKDAAQQILDYAAAVCVYEMLGTGANGVPVVQVMAEKLMLTNMTEVDYLSALWSQLAAMTEITYTSDGNLYLVELAGEEYTLLSVGADAGNGSIYQDYCVRKQDDRMVVISLTYTDETADAAAALFQAFTSYEQ